MNIFHIKYAVEVAKVGSINKASENLGMAQPNISRAIKDLEADFGITIFDRSAKGMKLTPEGRDFIAYAQKILEQMNELERKYKGAHPGREKLSVALPHGCYITDVISKFAQKLDKDEFELIFSNASVESAIKGVAEAQYHFAVIRYSDAFDELLDDVFAEKNLCCDILAETQKKVIVNKDCTLAQKGEICKDDLIELSEITDAGHEEHLRLFDALHNELHNHGERCLHLSDSLTQLEFLSENDSFFMIAPPLSKKNEERFGLVQLDYSEAKAFKDVLIYRNDHKPSGFEKDFIEILKLSCKEL